VTLGDRLSFDVSEYLGLHPDLFEVPGRGAFINSNPGASIMGAIPYALTRPAIDLLVRRVVAGRPAEPPEYDTPHPNDRAFYAKTYASGLDVKLGLAAGVMQVLLMAPFSALGVVLMFYVLARLGISDGSAAALALLYGAATPIFYRTAYLNQNLLLAHAAFLAFVLLWRPGARAAGRRACRLCATISWLAGSPGGAWSSTIAAPWSWPSWGSMPWDAGGRRRGKGVGWLPSSALARRPGLALHPVGVPVGVLRHPLYRLSTTCRRRPTPAMAIAGSIGHKWTFSGRRCSERDLGSSCLRRCCS